MSEIDPNEEPKTIDGIKVYDRDFITRHFGPLNEPEIAEFYRTVAESSEIDMMIGAVFCEFLLAQLAAVRREVGASDLCVAAPVRGGLAGGVCGLKESTVVHGTEPHQHPFQPEPLLAAVKRALGERISDAASMSLAHWLDNHRAESFPAILHKIKQARGKGGE